MRIADLVILLAIFALFAGIGVYAYKKHKKGIPLDCISCPLIDDQVFDHENCDHHAHFNQSALLKIKDEVHQELAKDHH